MASVLSVIAAIATLALMSRFSTDSATALGKVSAMVSVTATITEAWSKAQSIARQLRIDPTTVPLPTATTAGKSLMRREIEPEDDFLSENPSFRTGGLRGYSAYARQP